MASSWLNEGWTMYLERRIVSGVHGSDAHFDFSAIIGWKHLGKPAVLLFMWKKRATFDICA
jgi:aminopeptidase N